MPVCKLADTFEFVDRYDTLGMPEPDADDICPGQCEGTGWVPVYEDDPNDEEGNWHDYWLEAEAESPTDDGYHFVRCPLCGGTGKQSVILSLPGTTVTVGTVDGGSADFWENSRRLY